MLKQVAAPAQAGDAEAIGRDLLDTMRSFERCVGLAAPQIGELARVVAVDVRGHPKADTDNGLLVLVNPRIVEARGLRGRPRGLPLDSRPDRQRASRDLDRGRARRGRGPLPGLRGALRAARARPPGRDPVPRPGRVAGGRRLPSPGLRGQARQPSRASRPARGRRRSSPRGTGPSSKASAGARIG